MAVIRQIVVFLAVSALAAVANAETSLPNKQMDQVEMFAAMEADQISVKLIPKDATQSTVIIENKTDKPLSIKLPEAFAGVPVLAQADAGIGGGGRRGGGGRNGGGGGGVGGGGNQGMGGGMGGMGMGGMGMGGGMFNVGPEKIGKFKVATVCLEHGKDDPNPRIAYEIKPIEEFTQDARVIELCKLLGHRQIDQVSAQAAAWHLTDNLTWQDLAQKIRVKHLNGQVEMFFGQTHLQKAFRAVQVVTVKTKDEAESVSPGELADKQVRLDK
ncbi:MAG: hypothetical protein R3C28_08340 [Pirellulaceae bacterium]